MRKNMIYVLIKKCGGHTFCRGIEKPFDHNYAIEMVQTTIKLVEMFHAYTGYTQSDEITLVFPPREGESEIFFSGRVQKIVSILAGTVSAYFNQYFPMDDRVAVFDARIMCLPTKEEVFNNMMWRVRDCVRNSVAACAQAHFLANELHKKNRDDMKKMLRDIQKPWEDIPSKYQYGTFVKKDLTVN